jgi:hypothetical protein
MGSGGVEFACGQLSSLKLTISSVDFESWADWHRAVVIEGKSGPGDLVDGELSVESLELHEPEA